MVLQMKIDRLRYFHGAPPVVWIVRALCPHLSIHHDMDRPGGNDIGSGRISAYVSLKKVDLASMHLLRKTCTMFFIGS